MLKKIDGFIVGLLCMIALAYWFPAMDDNWSTINLETLTTVGISLIFFFYGLKLSPQSMKQGLLNYKLHLLVQLTTFFLFPLLVICLRPLVHSEDTELLWLALFFMAALPSTVSSSVVMVSIAKGNIPGAIFNASISGLIGIVLTPIWMGVFMGSADAGFDFWESVISLIVKILLPVIAGLSLNKFFGGTARKYRRYLTTFDKSIILLIVYNSFGKSFKANIFDDISLLHLGITAVLIGFTFVIIYGIVYYVAVKLSFSREDRITALFCGSKKSLVHGSVMANVLFKNMASQGIFIIPIMVYHSLQLIAVSFIAQRYARQRPT
ncbi:solute carrier family 10 (sodium/bile acid cotransporter), member 7 [Saccharicrinis carchari]|uniref:Solute carrier family 10 (Sodium/bile acid cotransporter), member 7 n=1 Tax=Saccharicrinis carchari TaxID=1168039 RepID=A0A521DAS2_SACCC|nr:bile acid:sodium symporter family protein [Saccharicrinis carchari]SMO68817.1 solute carrier family 10 (sodium/bile acid cotransporter), member 7 [Saccharicrinis carchari]